MKPIQYLQSVRIHFELENGSSKFAKFMSPICLYVTIRKMHVHLVLPHSTTYITHKGILESVNSKLHIG